METLREYKTTDGEIGYQSEDLRESFAPGTERHTAFVERIADNDPDLTFIPWVEPPDVYQQRRAVEYPPISDQLDVIWKQFNQMRLENQPLIQEADDMLGSILAVKAAHPKPS